MADTDTARVLDMTASLRPDGAPTLLDGKGGVLPPGGEPCFLEISRADLEAGRACNSRGEPFTVYRPVTPDTPHLAAELKEGRTDGPEG